MIAARDGISRICRTCCQPDTKPDLHFDSTGQCSACRAYSQRPEIDWDSRRADLVRLLDAHHGECIVPSSGGKDSTWQALTLKAMGADVTCVTATTCHLTSIGRANIDNLAKHCRTIEYTPDRTTRATLNRAGLELVGDISWPEHVSIFTTPFKSAIDLRRPLIFYGENPQNQYGGPPGTEKTLEMTRRWVAEFGGFLGLRPSDLIGQYGLTARDMADYLPPKESDIHAAGIQAHFLGQYIEWDSDRNAEVSIAHGMRHEKPTLANWWDFENLDNAQTGLHDYMMFRKYGYGRGCAQISVDVRKGKVSRDFALNWISEWDGLFPEVYAGVSINEVLDRIGLSSEDLNRIILQFSASHVASDASEICSRTA